jgi:DNA-binding Lrp family transcriptional regulator
VLEKKGGKMVTAYIFIITKPGSRADISSASFLKMEGVKDVTEVYGEYDIIIKVYVKKMEELQKFILNLRKLGGVDKTSTMISMND